MTKVILTGGAGNLGTYLLRCVPEQIRVVAAYRRTQPDWPDCLKLDLAEPAAIDRLVDAEPDLILHAAYGTGDLDRDVIQATRHVAEAAARAGCRLIHLSTDTLFDGIGGPYAESAEPSPIFPYGEAKAQAEYIVRCTVPQAAIVRCSLIIGTEPLNGSSAWIVNALRSQEPITLYVDELRRPIGAADLAAMIWGIAQLPEEGAQGIWHLVGPELLSRFALGLLLARRFDLDAAAIRPGLSADSDQPRPRVLDLTAKRAARQLSHRAKPISQWLGLDKA